MAKRFGTLLGGKLMRRAVAAHQEGQLLQAELLYREVLQEHPGNPAARHLLGVLVFQQGDHAEGLEHLEQAIKSDPAFAEAHNSLGNALQELGRFEEAVDRFSRGLRHDPGNADLLYNHGAALQALGRHEDAIASLRHALTRGARDAATLVQLGVSLRALEREPEALECFERALRLKPDSIDALSGRGNALLALDRGGEAVDSLRRAVALDNSQPQVRFNLALAELTTGDWQNGWRNYEARHVSRDFAGGGRQFAQPLWLGDASLAGRTILLHAEQGFGDTLMFLRYLPLVAARGARVVLEVQPRLAGLLSRLGDAAAVAAAGAELPPYDFHCPLPSLPLAFGTTPADVPPPLRLTVAASQASQWALRLPASNRPRVGLAWSGNAAFRKNRSRSMDVATLAPLLAETGVEFVSLQVEVSAEERGFLARHGVMETGEAQRDFSDAAALIERMDLVISVDTAAAHLAAALGKPVWLLLSRGADWRWMRNRDDSPWYPATRLFRQSPDDPPGWTAVIARVAAALRSTDVRGSPD